MFKIYHALLRKYRLTHVDGMGGVQPYSLCLKLIHVGHRCAQHQPTVKIPEQGAMAKDWNAKSFWVELWRKPGVHKVIDIFGKMNTLIPS